MKGKQGDITSAIFEKSRRIVLFKDCIQKFLNESNSLILLSNKSEIKWLLSL